MTDLATTVAPPQQSAARRFGNQLHVLVDEQTAAYIEGLAAINAEAEGIRPKQGETIRDLLDDAIIRAHRRDPIAYAEAVRRGRAALEEKRGRKA